MDMSVEEYFLEDYNTIIVIDKDREEVFDRIKPAKIIFNEIYNLINTDEVTQESLYSHALSENTKKIVVLWTGNKAVCGFATRFLNNRNNIPISMRYNRYREYGKIYDFNYIEISNQFHDLLNNHYKIIKDGIFEGWVLKVCSRPRNLPFGPFSPFGHKIKLVLKQTNKN